MGINDIKQFKNQDLFYWWQKKYIEISKNQHGNQNDLLINLNNAKEKLEIFDKEYLIDILDKKIYGLNLQKNSENAFRSVNVIIDFTLPKCSMEVLKIAYKLKKKGSYWNYRFFL